MRRALLVEDDLAIGRLVQAVAQDVGMELVHATSLAQARQALDARQGQSGGAFDVIVADLMLPDGSGVDWLEEQWASGRLADSRVLAFSAGVSTAARGRLGAVGVQGFLHKPVSVVTLAQWLSPETTPLSPDAPGARHPQHTGPAVAGAAGAGPEGADEAIAEWFAGDHQLFESFQAACLARAESDRRQGQAWLQQGQLTELARLAHSLKSALRLLGEPTLAKQAQTLELRCALPQDRQGAHQAWAQLAQGLSAWAVRVRGSGSGSGSHSGSKG